MKLFLTLFISCSFAFQALFAQEIDTPFGKNRVQYTDDFDSWSRYETENFITFWYGKSRNVAISALQMAEYDFREIQNILEHRINEKIELIVYGDLGELYQTNIGLQNNTPNNVETIQLVGSKLFVHFDGNHKNLRENIREGVAKVYIYSMLYGSNFQEMVQNSFMAEMPEWFKAGIIHYAKNKWTDEDDSRMRYALKEKKRPYKNFKKLSKKEPEIAGKAFWYYLGETYGISAISNVIYLTRINRSLKSAFRYVLGEEYDDVTRDCFEYYQNRYEKDVNRFAIPQGACTFCPNNQAYAKNSNGAEYQSISLSPSGNHVAYAKNNNGRIVFYIQDIKTKKKKKIKSFGYNNPYRETDYNYPIFFWTPDSKQLAYIYEYRNVIQIRIKNLESGETYKNTLNPIFNRIYSASFLDDENIIFSGNAAGFSDLYTYNLNTRIQKNITDDYYDDLDARVETINGIKGILFSSNRNKTDIFPNELDTTLIIDNFDIYFLPIEDKTRLFRLTNSEFADEFKAEYSNQHISFISDKYGVKTLVQQKVNNNFKLSNELKSIQFTSNIIDKSCQGDYCLFSTTYNNRDILYYDTLQSKKPAFTIYKQLELNNNNDTSPVIIEDEESIDVRDVDNIPSGWFFDTYYDDPPKSTSDVIEFDDNKSQSQNNKVHKFNPLRSTSARLRFKILDMSSNLDNKPLFGGLNSYSGDRIGYDAPPLGLLMKMKIGDSFEDYLVEGGIRLATNFSGYEAFLTYENRKKQWDHFYGAYYRHRSNRRIDQFDQIDRSRQTTFIAYYQIRYPLDEFQSFRFSGTLRNDRDFTKIVDRVSFTSPVVSSQRLGVRAEYVYDNSSQRSMNIYAGSRSKVFVEGMNRFRVQVSDPFVIEPSNGILSVFGIDSRYYLPVLEKSVLAARFSAGTSLGSERILYYVGGVERSLFSGFDSSTGIPDNPFAFENIAPQLRGFDRNIRNGTSYVVTTVELRVPVFRHLFSDQIKYDFLREFQVVGFFDSGTAWHGASPYSEQNPINSASFTSGDIVKLNVQYFRDPLVLGYGVGFRTSIFGYFVKLDFAKGIETRATLPTKVHISLGTDF